MYTDATITLPINMQSIVVDNTVLVVLKFSAFNRQGFHLNLNGTSAYLQPFVITGMPLSFSKPDVQLCLLAARHQED